MSRGIIVFLIVFAFIQPAPRARADEAAQFQVGFRPAREFVIFKPAVLQFSILRPARAAARRKLDNSTAFMLYAENIEYDPSSKTLKATHAEFRDALLSITADEIRMDLSASLLAAEGYVLIRPAYYVYIGDSLDGNTIFRQSGYSAGEFLIMNYKLREGRVRDGERTSAFSESHNSTAYGDLYYYAYDDETLQVLPAKTAPSVANVEDVAFSPVDDEKVIQGRMLSASPGGGLTFLDARYRDETDTRRQLPYLSTLTGELEKRSFHVQSFSAMHSPGADDTLLETQTQYLFSPKPQNRGIISTTDTHRTESDQFYQAQSEHDFNYYLSKTYYRGRNGYSGFAQRYENVFRAGGSYLRPWSLNDSTYALFRYSGEVNDYEGSYRVRSLSPSLWASHFSKKYYGQFQATQSSDRYEGNTGGISHGDNISSILNIERRPMPIFRNRAFLEIGGYARYYKYDDFAKNELFYKNITANIYGRPIKRGTRATLKPRLAWAHSSYRYFYENSTAPGNTYLISRDDEHAAGSVQLSWRQGNGDIGAEYISDIIDDDRRDFWRFFYSFAHGSKWNLRFSSDYVLKSGGDFASNSINETADLSVRLGGNMHLLSSFALDDEVYGAMMNRLDFFAEYPSGQLFLGMAKNNNSYFNYYRYGNPYVYYLAYYFTY